MQGFEAAVGGGADGSGAFAEDVSCGGGVEAEDGAEQDGFGLVRGQGGDQGDGAGGGDGVQGGLRGVGGGGPGGEVLGGQGEGGGPAGGAAQVRNIGITPIRPTGSRAQAPARTTAM